MKIFDNYKKVLNTIESCINYEQIRIARKLFHNFNELHNNDKNFRKCNSALSYRLRDRENEFIRAEKKNVILCK